MGEAHEPEHQQVELPSREALDLDLVRVLLEPPDLAVGRELARDVGRRLKRQISPLYLAEALVRLAPQQRSSRPQERTFVRAALMQRFQQDSAWTSQPILRPLPSEPEVESGVLEDGTWSWRLHSFATHEADGHRWGVLHLWLKNGLDSVGVGQPVAIALVDSAHALSWSPMAGNQVPAALCPDGCTGSLATVAVEPETEILGHLSFPLPADSEPQSWGLMLGHHAHLRQLTETQTA